MNLRERIDVLCRIHLLVSRKATGSPQALARRLELSLPSLYRYLDILRGYGAPLRYCDTNRHYYYEAKFELTFY